MFSVYVYGSAEPYHIQIQHNLRVKVAFTLLMNHPVDKSNYLYDWEQARKNNCGL